MFLLSCLFKQLKQTELLVCKTAAEPKPAFTAGAADPPLLSDVKQHTNLALK